MGHSAPGISLPHFMCVPFFHLSFTTLKKSTAQSQTELAFFYNIVEFSEHLYVSGEPLFKANPVRSTIKLISAQDFEKATTEEIQDMFRERHLLVTDLASQAAKCHFDLSGLSHLARTNQKISINGAPLYFLLNEQNHYTYLDQSIPVTEDHMLRLRNGTLQDILDNVNSPNGKALNALDLPMEDGIAAPQSLSSDMWAWARTVGLKLCKKRDRFPTTAMRWGLVSTADTYSVWHIDCDGLATMIEVQTGCKLWVLARPRRDEDLSCFSRLDAFLNFDADAVNDDRWDCEAVLLTPGSRL
jgi:hypothetical protein